MGPASLNYALPAPELRPITTQVFNENGDVKRCVSSPGMHMSNHSARFISALFASILAGTSFAAGPESGAKTADNCLSGPKGAIQAGHHWYYRIEQPSKRQCWYSRAETDKPETGKTARTAPQDSTPSSPSRAPSSSAATDPVPASQSLLAHKSIADARAELTSPQMRVEDTNANASLLTGGTAPTASLPSNQRAIAPDAAPPSSHVASRWPDTSGVSSSNDPRLAAAEPPASPQTSPAPQPATTPVALAAADSSLGKPSASIQMLLLVMAGALALAGITASLVFRFARANAPQPEIRGGRRAIWDQVDAERSSPSIFPNDDMPVWRSNVVRDLPRDPRAPDDPERRVTEMLARLARSAQT